MGFFEENWLWRGTQSAIFYYVSCSPCIEWKYKRKRRNEANRAQKERDEIIRTQPGRVQQPGAFQTNEGWAEEILMGPGPPKGWKRDPVVEKIPSGHDKLYAGKKSNSLDGVADHVRRNGESSITGSHKPYANLKANGVANNETCMGAENHTAERQTELQIATSGSLRQSIDSVISSSSTGRSAAPSRPRPSFERRFSNAMDNFRVTLRSTMRPENWNWIRYERDDEVLSGFNQRMTDMWNRATNFGLTEKTDDENDANDASQRRKGRKRADTVDSDHFDYQRYTRNPEINELHPPVVSRLPTTSDDATWMMLPPPSAAIMEGKARPQDEPAMRWPLARIGRTPEEWKTLSKTQSTEKARAGSGQPESIPELSDSFTEASSVDEESWQPGAKRHSAPAVDSNKPSELGLVYVDGQRMPQDRAGVLAGQ